MKFWLKIYLVTLIAFLIFLNSGIYVVFQITYQKNIETEQRRAESDYCVMEYAIEKNMIALEQQNRLNETTITSLMESFEQYYDEQNLSLELWKYSSQVYPKAVEEDKEKDKGNETLIQTENVMIKTINKNKYIYLTDKLEGLEEEYFLVYIRPLTDLNEIWNQLNVIYVISSIGISCCMAIILFVLLKRLMKPIKRFSYAANLIANGNYQERVDISGRDELAELARSFNHMAEEIEEKIKEITDETEKKQVFIDNLAHELKTPLTTIYGFAEYMQKAKMSEEDRRVSLEYMMEESKRLKNLAYSLLDLAMLRNEKIEFELLQIDKVLYSALKTVEMKFQEKQIQVNMKKTIDDIWGNRNLLESLFINLLMNAAYACETGGEIGIFINKIMENGVVEIKISDNGIGISEGELLHITEPFYRVDKARSRLDGGAGIGLSLCKQIVAVHNGEMKYLSKPGVGTTVIISLYENKSK